MARSDELLLSRIQKAWASYKSEVGASQASAAEALGMNQSAFSQYLRGAIPLNTDFLVRFSRLTNHSVTDVVEEMSAGTVRTVALPVKATLSGGEREGRVTVSSIVPVGDCYLIENDYPSLPYRMGDYFIVDPRASVEAGAMVFVSFGRDAPPTIGEIRFVNNDWVLIEERALGGRRLPLSEVHRVDLIVGTYNKPTAGRTFKTKGNE